MPGRFRGVATTDIAVQAKAPYPGYLGVTRRARQNREGGTLTAYILIQATPDADRSQLARAVAQLPGVDRVQAVSGPYDVIAEAREDAAALTRMTVPEIARLSGVLRVITSPIESPFVPTNQEAAL